MITERVLGDYVLTHQLGKNDIFPDGAGLDFF
jgi:hypothetical protein